GFGYPMNMVCLDCVPPPTVLVDAFKASVAEATALLESATGSSVKIHAPTETKTKEPGDVFLPVSVHSMPDNPHICFFSALVPQAVPVPRPWHVQQPAKAPAVATV